MTDAGQIAATADFDPEDVFRGSAVIFDPSTGWAPLFNPGTPCLVGVTPPSEALDINPSGDVGGSVGIGFAGQGCPMRAYLWRRDGTGVEQLAGDDVDGAEGSTIGGAAMVEGVESGAIWRSDGSGLLVDDIGFVTAISGDGSVVLGSSGHRWTEAGVSKLPVPEGCLAFEPTAVTEDGNVVFGTCPRDPSVAEAFVWTEEHGHRRLADLAAEVGVVLRGGAFLTKVRAVSADGAVVVGDAKSEAGHVFVLSLPAEIYGI